MSRIFISYRRDETAAWAFMMNERLAERFGADKIFMDIDSIEPGDDFVEVIKSKVGACEVLVVLIGRAWLTCTDESGRRRLDNHDDFVRLEVKAALERGIRVIPVLVNGARPPRPEEVPDDLSPLCHRNALALTEVGYRQDLGRLVDIVAKAIGLTEPAPAAPAAAPDKGCAATEARRHHTESAKAEAGKDRGRGADLPRSRQAREGRRILTGQHNPRVSGRRQLDRRRRYRHPDLAAVRRAIDQENGRAHPDRHADRILACR